MFLRLLDLKVKENHFLIIAADSTFKRHLNTPKILTYLPELPQSIDKRTIF